MIVSKEGREKKTKSSTDKNDRETTMSKIKKIFADSMSKIAGKISGTKGVSETAVRSTSVEVENRSSTRNNDTEYAVTNQFKVH